MISRQTFLAARAGAFAALLATAGATAISASKVEDGASTAQTESQREGVTPFQVSSASVNVSRVKR